MSKAKKKTEMVEIACRCKDCDYSYNPRKADKKLYCYLWGSTTEPEEVKPDWFCSNGSVT